MWSITRLKTVPPLAILESMDDEGAASEIEDHVLDSIALDQWVVRKSAAATLVHEHGCWAEDGMAFGNEGYEALLYTLAALEVTTSKPKPVARPTTKAKAVAKPKSKAKAGARSKAKAVAKAKAKPKPKAKSKSKAKTTRR